MSSPQESSVQVRGVDFSFSSGRAAKQVLFDCNLELYPGEVNILTGPSGSGKTTLLTLIGALRSLQKGSIKVFGRELLGLGSRGQTGIRREVGFIFQDHNLFEALTAGQTLRLAMRLFPGRYDRRAYRELPQQMLEALGMEAYLHSRPAALSTGQKQRVAIARALINHPRLILADEPTASLDRETGLVVMRLLKSRAEEEGASVIIISHDQRLFPFADRVIRMEDGRLSVEQVTQTLEDRPYDRGGKQGELDCE